MGNVSCLIFLANVCLQHIGGLEIHDSGLSASATVHGSSFTAEVVYRSDEFSPPDWKKMDEACWEGKCIAYHKWCTKKEGRRFCEYQFSQPGDMQNTIIRVSAENEGGISDAEKDIAVLTRNNWDAIQIPLERFVNVSDSETPPSCVFRQPRTVCWPAKKR